MNILYNVNTSTYEVLVLSPYYTTDKILRNNRKKNRKTFLMGIQFTRNKKN